MMASRTLGRRLRRVPRLIPRWTALVAWSVLAATVITLVWPKAIDFYVYWDAANYVLSGERKLYNQIFSVGLPFTYPPFALLLFLPFGAVAAPVSLFLLRVVSLIVFAEVCWIAGRVLPQSLRPHWKRFWWLLPVSLLTLASPVRETLDKGQINLLIMGACVLALIKLDGFWSGFIIGLTGGVKLTPLALGIIYLKRRDWTAVLGMGAGLGTSVLLGFIMLPVASARFWTSAVRDPNRVGNPGYVGNASLLGIFERLPIDSKLTPWLWILLSLLVVSAAYVLIPQRRDISSAVTAAGIGALVMLLISPISWTHHWVWLPLVAGASLNAPHHLPRRHRLLARGLWLLVGAVVIIGPLEITHLIGFSGNDHLWPLIILGSILPITATAALFYTTFGYLKKTVSGLDRGDALHDTAGCR